MLNRSLAVLCAGFLALAAHNHGAKAQDGAPPSTLGTQGLSDADASAIKSLVEEWTKDLQAREFGAWEKYWTKDAALAAPDHERMVGEAAIAAYVKENFPTATGFSFADWAIAGRKDLAVVTNTLTWQASGGDESYDQMIVLRHGAGGWRVQSVLYTTTK